MNDSLILMIAAFVAISSFVLIIALFVIRRPSAVEARVEGLAAGQAAVGGGNFGASSGSITPSRVNITEEQAERRTLGDRLIQAGLYKQKSISFYVTTQVILASIPIFAWMAVASGGWMTTRQALVYGVMTGIPGIIFPSFWLDAQKKRRQTLLRRSLPDALDVIVVCVEAGMSLPAAFARVSHELRTAHPMLAAEMIIVQREIQMGCSTGEALRRFAARFDLEELRSLASVILQAEKFGASIVQALKVNAEGLRVKRFQQAEERAQKATVKLLFPTIFLIFPSIFVVVLGPAAFQLYELFTQTLKNR